MKAAAIAIAIALTVVSVAAGGSLPFITPAPVGGGMSFQQCYVGCFILCAIQPSQTLSSCGFQCLRDCLIPSAAADGRHAAVPVTGLQYCKLGCASDRCANLSTLNNPGGKEVAGCVGSCSGTCMKNYMAMIN